MKRALLSLVIQLTDLNHFRFHGRMILLCCLLITSISFSQDRTIDSLESLLKSGVKGEERVDVLNELSYNHYDVNDSLANSYAQQALSLSSELNYPEGLKYANTLVGLGFFTQSKHDQARRYFRASQNIISENAQPITVYNLMLWGAMYSELSMFDSALYYYSRARSETRDSFYADKQAIYKNVAGLFLLQWENEKALVYLDSAFRLKEYGDDYMAMEIYGMYGIAYQNLLQYDKSRYYFQEQCKLSEANNDYYHKVECKLNQSKFAIVQGEFEQALAFSLEAHSLTSQRYNHAQYVDVLTQIGESYMELSELELTGQYLFMALKISESNGLVQRTARLYNDLAWLNKMENKYDEAIAYAEKAQKLFKKIGDKRGESESHNVKGLTYFLTRDFKQAGIEYDKALSIREDLSDMKGVSATLYNKSELLIELRKSNEALPILKRVIDIEEKIGNKPYLAMTYGVISRLYTDLNRYDEAFQYLEKISSMNEPNQSLFIQRDNASHFVYYYKSIRDYKKALEYQQLYQLLNDSIHNHDAEDRLAEYEALYRLENRDKEIELLNQKQKIQESKIELQRSELVRKNTVITASIIISVLLGIAGFRTYRFNKSKESTNKRLVKLNEEITDQNKSINANLSHIKQLQSDLTIKEKQYRDLVENASDIIHELDENGRFTYVNHAIEQIAGFTESDLLGKHYKETIHPEYVESVVDTYRKQLKECREFSYLEFPVLTKNGETIWLGQNTRFFFKDGRMRKVGVVARDITKQKIAEEELVKSRLEYETLVETVPIGVYKTITYPDGSFKFSYVSPRWCALNNLKQADILKDSSLAINLIHPDDRSSFHSAEKNGLLEYSFSWEGRMIINGVVKHFQIESRGSKRPDGTIVRTGIQSDITERKLAEIEIVKAKEEAEIANAAKSDFIANMSHEMRTPLNGVIGFSDLVMKSGLNVTQVKYMSMVSQSAHVLLNMIDDILDFSKMEAGQLKLDYTKMDIVLLCEQIVELFKLQAEKKNIDISLKLATDVPRVIISDEMRLRQVLNNLLSNAIKFTLKGEIEFSVDRIVTDTRESLRIAIRDTGVGIAPENQRRIFDAFVQEDLSATKKFGGTGLGLTIASRILKLMGSELLLISKPNEGSTFYFDLTL
jgi:PAS domain S-box-containing protein